jgi:hypothetical protein
MDRPKMEDQETNQETIDELGRMLSDGWRKYTELFGEVPHGTEKQMRTLCLLSRLDRWRSSKE